MTVVGDVSTRPARSGTRLAVLAPDLGGGGAERAALKLAEGFAERGYEADLVLVRATGARMAEVSPKVHIVDLGAARVATSLPALVRYLRRARPLGLVSVLDHTNLVALAARRIARYRGRVIVVEQNHLSSAATNGSSRRDRMMPALARRFFPSADYVVGVSKGVTDDLRERIGLPAERLRVVFNPIITPDIAAKAAEPVDHRWFSDGGPVLVAAGRFRPQKDFPALLHAVALVRDRCAVRLVVLGDGPDREQLEALVDRLGLGDVVDLPGSTDNPYAYFAKCTAYVLSSRWEGLPTVLIEALACGAPIVATDCPSGPQEILDGGRYGILVPVGDVAALASAIEHALAGDVRRAPAESWQPYTLAAVTDAYLELLEGTR